MISTNETLGSTVEAVASRVNLAVVMPKSDRINASKPKVDVALTGKADTEDKAHKELKEMLRSACVAYSRGSESMRTTIEKCKAAGVTDAEIQAWLTEFGFPIQTYRNAMVAIRKDNGAMLKIVKRDDKRLAKNRMTETERTDMERAEAYLLKLKDGDLNKAAKFALALNRRFVALAKAGKVAK